jgi:hypothetical protein
MDSDEEVDRKISIRIDELISWGYLKPFFHDGKQRGTILTEKGLACLSACAEKPLTAR